MKNYNLSDWCLLLSNYAISGDLKIECIKKYLSLDWSHREKRVILEDFKKQLDKHSSNNGMDYDAYRWLDNHHYNLKENPSTVSKKTKWEEEIEKPLINVFRDLKVKFPFANSLQHKKTVIKNYEKWNTLLRDDCFIKVLDFVKAEILKLNESKEVNPQNKANKPVNKSSKLSFGFKGNREQLKLVFSKLISEIDFLENENLLEELVEKFTAKDIKVKYIKFNIGCETKVFRYCIDQLMPHCKGLSLINIERTNMFYSNQGNLIKASNLSASASQSEVEPKAKATIDKIFKHLQ